MMFVLCLSFSLFGSLISADVDDSTQSFNNVSSNTAQSFVEILEVSRTQVEGDYTFVVQYREVADELELYWYNHTSNIPDVRREVKPGVKETKVVINGHYLEDSSSKIRLDISSENNRFIVLEFYIFKPTPSDFKLSDLMLPISVMEPSGDIVYKEGSDASIKVTTTLCEGDKQPYFRVDTDDLLDIESGESVEIKGPRFEMNFTEIETRSVSNSSVEVTVKMKTSEHHLSGVVSLSLDRLSHASDFLYLTVRQSKVIRPETQLTPYPPSYLHFKSFEDERRGDDGVLYIPCLENKPCLIACHAIGQDITEVNLVKISEDGTRTDVPGVARYGRVHKGDTDSFSIFKSAVFQGDIDFYKGGTFECSARNAHGSHLTKNYTVYIRAEFIKERSQVTVIRPQDGSGPATLNVTCTIKGLRQVNVVFIWLDPKFNPDMSPVIPDVVTALPGNEYAVTKQITFDATDDHTTPKLVFCMERFSEIMLDLRIPDSV